MRQRLAVVEFKSNILLLTSGDGASKALGESSSIDVLYNNCASTAQRHVYLRTRRIDVARNLEN
jgi:hypothetical protein